MNGPRHRLQSVVLIAAFYFVPADAQIADPELPAVSQPEHRHELSPATSTQPEPGFGHQQQPDAADSLSNVNDRGAVIPDYSTLATTMPLPLATPPVVLTVREVEAVQLSRDWQERYSPAMLGYNGKVVYHFGESSASVITSPGDVTQIELQPGEMLVQDGIFIGDSVNWRIIPVAQGSGPDMVTHIIVKPAWANLETTMIAITDRRSYYFHLKSTEDQFMASVGFEYPEIEARRWHDYQSAVHTREVAQAAQREQNRIEVTDTIAPDLASLDFGYTLSGDTPAWLPVRVYNDGRQVYIQMPAALRQSDAPAFIELGNRDVEQVVNYRLRRDTFIVDKLFAKGMLVAGTGRNQHKVVIHHTPTP